MDGHDQAAWSKHLHGYIRVYLIESSLEIVGFPSLVFHLVYGFLYFLVSLLLTWKLLFLSRISKTWRKFRWFFHVLNISTIFWFFRHKKSESLPKIENIKWSLSYQDSTLWIVAPVSPTQTIASSSNKVVEGFYS